VRSKANGLAEGDTPYRAAPLYWAARHNHTARGGVLPPAHVTDERGPLFAAELLLPACLPLNSEVDLPGQHRGRERNREIEHAVMVLGVDGLGVDALGDGEAPYEATVRTSLWWRTVCPEPVPYAGLNLAKIGDKVRRFLHVRIGPELAAERLLDRSLTPTDDDHGRLLIRPQATQQEQEVVAVQLRDIEV
jgi:hypothetical protein